jgi:UV DNA damage endonuclease
MRGVRPKVHLSSQDPAKRPGAHAIEAGDWAAFLDALGGRQTDVMVEGKELALPALGAFVV